LNVGLKEGTERITESYEIHLTIEKLLQCFFEFVHQLQGGFFYLYDNINITILGRITSLFNISTFQQFAWYAGGFHTFPKEFLGYFKNNHYLCTDF